MNRKQRRAERKQPSAARGHGPTPAQLFAEALRHQRNRQLDAAARCYKRLLALEPDHAEAANNLAQVLQAQGRLGEASFYFARTLEAMPQLLGEFGPVRGTLMTVLPALGEAVRRADAAWPQRLPIAQLFGEAGLKAVAADPLLLTVLGSTPVRDIGLERLLTSLRAALLDSAEHPSDDSILAFCCALARQCFINEYVFATTPGEDGRIERLKKNLRDLSAMQLAAVAMYEPLHSLPDAETLLERTWPRVVEEVLTQQLREPNEERALHATIPKLTPIDDDTSQRVRQMYEENPYPRWVLAPRGTEPRPVDLYLRQLFPTAAFTPLGKTGGLDVLVAGCGTGWHAIGMAQVLQNARVLAIDLSLASLAYAKRRTPASLAIDYAQADILALAALERRFDVVDASGVLHHMADPFAGWRALAGLLRPNGLMHLGLYSELGRRDVVAARAFIAARGYGASPAEIRRARQDLLATPLAAITRIGDFFSTSECRDLLFHVQESRTTIPAIKAFLGGHGLTFIGFEFGEAQLRRYRALFAEKGWSTSDLDRWHEIETGDPDTFSGMYQFWVQKS
jgi:2-polyprenyl-3-methyl-5-hydroxy-6-metoxy-1,4-benzoquinol methylase/transposase-like protein